MERQIEKITMQHLSPAIDHHAYRPSRKCWFVSDCNGLSVTEP